MNEYIPNHTEQTRLDDVEYRKLAENLRERVECFPFPGLRVSSYEKLKAESDEFPELMTPIDELVKSFQENGFQIIEEANGNIFILPFNIMPTPNNVRDFSIFPKHLEITPDMDPELKRLILARW